MNGLAYLMKGGPIMYILLPMSGVALAVILERYLFLRREKMGTLDILSILRKGALGDKEMSEIRKLLEKPDQSNLIIGKILSLFLNRRLSEGDLEHLVEAEALIEEKRLKERMWVLDTTVTMAPLLGLLGTIIGIISSFHVMSVSGLGKPAQITGGVAEALIATATGLVIAIISLGFYNHLNSSIREIRNSIESAARLLFHLQDRLRNVPGNFTASTAAPVGEDFASKAQPAFNVR